MRLDKGANQRYVCAEEGSGCLLTPNRIGTPSLELQRPHRNLDDTCGILGWGWGVGTKMRVEPIPSCDNERCEVG